MKENLIIENSTAYLLDYEKFYKIFEIILDNESHPKIKKIVNLLFTHDKEMMEYNFKYRKKNETTDVLSFEDNLEFSPVLGDIIINLQQADRQKENNLLDEGLFLFIHGMLHLLGYDHLNKEDEKIMKHKENRYFTMLKE